MILKPRITPRSPYTHMRFLCIRLLITLTMPHTKRLLMVSILYNIRPLITLASPNANQASHNQKQTSIPCNTQVTLYTSDPMTSISHNQGITLCIEICLIQSPSKTDVAITDIKAYLQMGLQKAAVEASQVLVIGVRGLGQSLVAVCRMLLDVGCQSFVVCLSHWSLLSVVSQTLVVGRQSLVIICQLLVSRSLLVACRKSFVSSRQRFVLLRNDRYKQVVVVIWA